MATASQNSMSPQNFFGFSGKRYQDYFPASAPALPGTDPYGALAGYDPNLEDRAYNAGQLEAVQENFDPNDPESVSGLQKLVAMGKVSPSVSRALLPKTTGRYGMLSPENAQTAAEISTIPWNEDDAQAKVSDAIQRNPGFAATPQGQSWLTAFQKHQQTAGPKNDMGIALAKAGIHPDDFDQYRNPQTGKFDPYKVQYAVGQAERGIHAKDDLLKLPPEKESELIERGAALDADVADEDRIDWLARHGNPGLKVGGWFSSPTPQQMDMATQGVKNERIHNFASRVGLLNSLGYRLPKALQDTAAAVSSRQLQPIAAPPPDSVAAPTQAAPAQPQIPSFNTPQEAEVSGVPSGTIVIIGGRRFRKD